MSILGLYLTGAKDFVVRNSPTILTITAVAGVVSTAALAVRATPRACELIEEDFRQNGSSTTYPDVVKRYVQTTWRLYLPAIAVGAVTVTCILASNKVNLTRNAALASAYSITERAMSEYQRKAVEVFGEDKHKEIKDRIAQDRVTNNPPKDSTLVFTGKGQTLCLDMMSGRYFRGDIEDLRRAENRLNQRLINGTWLGLNELYSEIGLEPIKLGDDLGWVTDNLLQLQFSAALSPDEEPCIVMDYAVDPKFDPYSG